MRTNVILFILCLLSARGYSQTTYYWVGGTAAASNFTSNSNWNTVKGSTSAVTQRTAAAATDILIFDGSDYGSGVSTGTATANLTSTTCGQLRLQNAANVNIQRNGTGTGTLTVSGGTGDDLSVSVTDSLTLSSNDPAGTAIILIQSGNTGSISGKVNITNGGCRIGCMTIGGVQVESGAVVYTNVTSASSYPFGGSVAQAVDKAIVFKSGSKAILRGGNSLFGNNGSFNPIVFQTGSTAVLEAANPAGMFNNRTYANVIVRPLSSAPSTPVTVTVDGTFYNIDTLTIDPLATFNMRASGISPIAGDIINNGTFGSATPITTSNLLMDGIVPQQIRGAGTFTDLGGLSVATGASLKLQHSLVISGTTTSSITGALNLQNYTISGTANFQFRGAATTTFTANTITGDYSVTNVSDVSGMAIGLLVTGPGISADTYIIGTNSAAFSFTLSKPATATATGVTLTTTGNPATCEIANTGGVDATIATTGATRGFGSTTNYIFNTATTTPFSDISNPNSSAGCRNVTVNAPISTNRLINVSGALTLNNNKLTVRSSDTVRILTSGSIGGTINSNSYIVTEELGSNLGIVRIDTFNAPITFPVGTSNYYMPVLVSPSSASTFAVGVYEGVTEEGTPNGTPFSAAKKMTVVDATWNINRLTSNTDIATINVSWPQALEGATFTAYPDANVGISRYNGTAWTITGGVGDNTNNNASNDFNNFSPFGVGRLGTVLPIQLTGFRAQAQVKSVVLDWELADESGISRYLPERSTDGINFTALSELTASNKRNYSYTDLLPLTGISYYRLRMQGNNGSNTYSNTVKVKYGEAVQMKITPNIVFQPQLDLQLQGWEKGRIEFRILNSAGQLAAIHSMNYDGYSNLVKIPLPAGLAKGWYRLQAIGNSNQKQENFVIR